MSSLRIDSYLEAPLAEYRKTYHGTPHHNPALCDASARLKLPHTRVKGGQLRSVFCQLGAGHEGEHHTCKGQEGDVSWL